VSHDTRTSFDFIEPAGLGRLTISGQRCTAAATDAAATALACMFYCALRRLQLGGAPKRKQKKTLNLKTKTVFFFIIQLVVGYKMTTTLASVAAFHLVPNKP
jgi:hypothetical protein